MEPNTMDLNEIASLIKKESLVGDKPIFNKEDFKWIKFLEEKSSEIYDEYLSFLRYVSFNKLPNFQDISIDQMVITNDDQWKIIPLMAYNETNKITASLMPLTFSIINSIHDITTCFFSILAPGKHIPLHRGPYAGVLRCHIPIKVPVDNKNCFINVGGQKHIWQKGQGFVFDDSYDHEVYNNTDEIRIVLFIDFLRPLPSYLQTLNKNVIKNIQSSDFIKNPKSAYEDWEKRHLEES